MRIVAGKYRGLKLNEFEYDNIRPTIDRVREAIFNKIQFRVLNANVLDLFGGTGAVSLEFVSRGSNVITVDNNPNSVKLIKQNFSKAKIAPKLLEMDYMKALKKLKSDNLVFDIIFLDPPFASDFADNALEFISKNEMLTSDGIIVYEHVLDKEVKIPELLEVVDEKKYGTVKVTYIGCKNG